MDALAQWSGDPATNTAVCAEATEGQYYPTIVSDGAGGAIVTWEDRRSGVADIYARRISALGVALWAADGIAICTSVNGQETPTVVSDGAGGAIISWADQRNGNNDVYAQRVTSTGVVRWASNGVAVTIASGDQVAPKIVSDGAGGAVIAWEDSRNDPGDIYAQRIDSSGTVMWTAGGVAICTAQDAQRVPAIVSDGQHGAILAWQDLRGGGSFDIYAQRVTASGVTSWDTNGVAVCTASNGQNAPSLASDQEGGAIISWYDLRNGSNDIYAQRLNSSGAVLWTADGVGVCVAGGHQYYPVLVSDGASGAVITWEDRRGGFSYDIYAQRVNAAGTVQWSTNGVAICTAAGDHRSPTIVSDLAGGAIITWQDTRTTGSTNDIYAQRIGSSGTVQWTAQGVAISTAPNNQLLPTIASDGAGGAITCWYDSRTGLNHDIYAQQINVSGQLGVVTDVRPRSDAVPASFRLEQNYPNPFNPATTIAFHIPSSAFVTLRVFDALGREVATIMSGNVQAGSHSRQWNAERMAGGVYFYRLVAGDFVQTKKLVVLK
jgi:hypothetical protein